MLAAPMSAGSGEGRERETLRTSRAVPACRERSRRVHTSTRLPASAGAPSSSPASTLPPPLLHCCCRGPAERRHPRRLPAAPGAAQPVRGVHPEPPGHPGGQGGAGESKLVMCMLCCAVRAALCGAVHAVCCVVLVGNVSAQALPDLLPPPLAHNITGRSTTPARACAPWAAATLRASARRSPTSSASGRPLATWPSPPGERERRCRCCACLEVVCPLDSQQVPTLPPDCSPTTARGGTPPSPFVGPGSFSPARTLSGRPSPFLAPSPPPGGGAGVLPSFVLGGGGGGYGNDVLASTASEAQDYDDATSECMAWT